MKKVILTLILMLLYVTSMVYSKTTNSGLDYLLKSESEKNKLSKGFEVLIPLGDLIKGTPHFRNYCDASTTNENEYIQQVVCGSIDLQSGWQAGVANYTSVYNIIEPGQWEDITVTNGNAVASDVVFCWVDWDQDFEFEEGNELFMLTNVGGAGQTFSGVISVPPDTPEGDYRLRIRMTNTVPPEPCGASAYGEIEDYTIKVDSWYPSLPGPDGLTGTFIPPNSALLQWYYDGPGICLQHCGENNGGLGLENGGTFYVSAFWDSVMLAPYNGYFLNKAAIFPTSTNNAAYELMIWTDDNGGTLWVSQPLTGLVMDAWNDIEFAGAIELTAGTNLRVGYRVTHNANDNPVGIDNGPAVAGYGDMVSFDGVTWESLMIIFGMDFNFNIKAFVTDEIDGQIAQPLPNPGFNNRTHQDNFVFEKRTENPSQDNARVTFLGHNIYRDDVLVGFAPMTQETYMDCNLFPGVYSYCVRAVYEEGLSEPVYAQTLLVPLSDTIIYEPFEDYTAGGYLAQQANAMGRTFWTTWSNAPGTAEDPFVSNEQASEGNNSAVIEGTNDCVLLLGDKTEGNYDLDFDIFVASGHLGYFNLLHFFAGPDSEWGLQVYFDENGAGTVDAGGVGTASFSYNYDSWIPVKVNVNLNDDLCKLYINNVMVVEYLWSLGTSGTPGLNQLAAANFYAWTDQFTSKYYVDEIDFHEAEIPPPAPVIQVEPMSLYENHIIVPSITQKILTVTNLGNDVLNWDLTINANRKLSAPSSENPANRDYCDASTQTEDEYIANVLCGDIDNSSGWQGGVANYTNISTMISPGTYEEITVTNGNSWANDIVYCWVDWDQDYEFEGGSELFMLTNIGGSGHFFEGLIYVPSDTPDGEYRLRVRMTYSTAPLPCGDANYGEVEDYTIVVGNYNPPTWLSASPTTGSLPPGGSSQIVVTFDSSNLGTGNTSGELVFNSNDPNTPVLVVPAVLTFCGLCAEILVNPTNFLFILDPNMIETQEMNIYNIGTETLYCEMSITYDDFKNGKSAIINKFNVEEYRDNHTFSNQNSEAAPESLTPASVETTDAMWDLQFSAPCGDGSGEAGIETDGNFIYTTKWNGTGFFKYEMDGTFIGPIMVGNVSGIRDLAFDGTYFYGGTAATTVYKMDFSTQTLVGQFTAPTEVRAIAYDYDEDGFYVNNWSTPIILFDASGFTLNTLPTAGDESYYGFAYDNNNGSKRLYGFSQKVGLSGGVIFELELPIGTPTEVSYDVVTELANPGTDLAGGLFTCNNWFVNGTTSIGGLVQNVVLFAYELHETEGPVEWLSLSTYNATVDAGGSATIDVICKTDEWGEPFYYTATIWISNNSINNPMVTIPVTLETWANGIDKNSDRNFILMYPNPTTDFVNIKSNSNINQVRIFNQAGQMVLSQEASGYEVRVETNNFRTGTYFVEISSAAGVVTSKLIVK